MLSNQQVETVDFIPHEGQRKIFASKKRFIFAMGGNRGGKTTAGCYWSYLGQQTPNTNHLIAACTEDQLMQSTLTKFFEIFPQLKRFWIKRDKMMSLPNGSRVFFRSLHDPNTIKGLNIHSAFVDEGDGLLPYNWTVLESRTATTKGKILVTSTIYPSSWIYDMIYKDNSKMGAGSDYEIITWESRINPSFSQQEWDRLKATTDPITFAREYESKFAFATGRVYEGILDYGRVEKFPDGSAPIAYVFGLDYGVNDANSISVCSYNTDNCWYIVDEYYRPGLSIQEVNYWLDHFIKKYGRPYNTFQDPAGGIARLSIISQANPKDAIKKIQPRITLVRDLIYQKRLFMFTRCVNHEREFKSYMMNPMKDEPEDKNNHAMDSMGMAIHNAHEIMESKSRGLNKPVEEETTAFWGRKKAQGIYKGAGMLEDKTEQFKEMGGDEWWEY